MCCTGNIVPGSAEFYSSHCDHVLPGLLLCGQPCLSGTQGGCSPQLQVCITFTLTVKEKVSTWKRGPFTVFLFSYRPTFQVYARYTCEYRYMLHMYGQVCVANILKDIGMTVPESIGTRCNTCICRHKQWDRAVNTSFESYCVICLPQKQLGLIQAIQSSFLQPHRWMKLFKRLTRHTS